MTLKRIMTLLGTLTGYTLDRVYPHSLVSVHKACGIKTYIFWKFIFRVFLLRWTAWMDVKFRFSKNPEIIIIGKKCIRWIGWNKYEYNICYFKIFNPNLIHILNEKFLLQKKIIVCIPYQTNCTKLLVIKAK